MSIPAAQLVIAEDDARIRDLLVLLAGKAGFTVAAAENGEAALALVGEETELFLSDLRMPVLDGFGCLERLAAEWPGIPTIVLSAEHEAGDAVRAMKFGAIDYLTKPFNPDELTLVLRNARRLRQIEQENEALREALGSAGPERELVVISDSMKEVRDQALQAAGSDAPVLLTGESGTGKDTVARLIHSRSSRASRPFVTVNCAEYSWEVLAAELFGNERGAFVGALRPRLGRIDAARGGTLALLEIGDLPHPLQSRLARLLETNRFRRVGGRKRLKADIRIITSSTVDLQDQVDQGSFSDALFDRLNILPIAIPPLRERLEELGALSEAILARLQPAEKGPKLKLARDVMRTLQAYDWPGNLRQLDSILERAAAVCQDGIIQVDDLPPNVQGSTPDSRIPAGIGGIPLADLEREALLQTLNLCGGNKSETARRLGVTEKSIYNKLKRFGLM